MPWLKRQLSSIFRKQRSDPDPRQYTQEGSFFEDWQPPPSDPFWEPVAVLPNGKQPPIPEPNLDSKHLYTLL